MIYRSPLKGLERREEKKDLAIGVVARSFRSKNKKIESLVFLCLSIPARPIES